MDNNINKNNKINKSNNKAGNQNINQNVSPKSRNNLPIIPIIVIIILIVLALIIAIYASNMKPKVSEPINETQAESAAIIEKDSYSMEENGRVKITNKTEGKICFSSCFPYYLEVKKGEEFESYSYLNCDTPDVVEKCLDPLGSETFEFSFALLEEGIHRLAIPLCLDCNEGEDFKEEQRLYTNEFNLYK